MTEVKTVHISLEDIMDGKLPQAIEDLQAQFPVDTEIEMRIRPEMFGGSGFILDMREFSLDNYQSGEEPSSWIDLH